MGNIICLFLFICILCLPLGYCTDDYSCHSQGNALNMKESEYGFFKGCVWTLPNGSKTLREGYIVNNQQ